MILLQLGFSLPIVLTSTVDVISKWLDKFVVSFFFGAGSLGIFYVGAIEIPFIGVIVSSVYSVVSPVLNSFYHKNDTEGFVKLSAKTLKFTSKIVLPIFMYLFVFADYIIPLVFKEDFQGAVTPFRIYLLLMPLRIASYGVLIVALGRPRVVFWSACAALGLNFVLNIVLALQIGFIGPAIATVISTYFHVFLLLFIILKELHVTIRDLIPFGHLFAVGVTCGLSVLIAYALTIVFEENLGKVVFSFVIFSVAYIFLGAKAGLILLTDYLDLAGGKYFGTRSGGQKG